MKKTFKLSSIVPLTGSYLNDNFSEYFGFMRHMVGDQKWFLQLIDEQENIHHEIFKTVSSARSVDQMLIDLGEALLANTSKQVYYFLKLRSCVLEYVAKNNSSLLFMFSKMGVSRDYVIKEVEKTKAAGKVEFDVYPIPKAELDRLFSKAMKVA